MDRSASTRQIICEWTTYKGSHCKRITSELDYKKRILCPVHSDLMTNYTKVETEGELCETHKNMYVVPRSLQHIRCIMTSLGNDDDIVDVRFAGGSMEKADISNSDFILLISDNSRFFYNAKKGQKRASGLKIELVNYCQNDAVVKFNNVCYCEECYKKLKDVPRISLVL